MIACFVLDKIGIACERARLPYLATEPVVLTTADGAQVVVASSEAERYGVQAGQSVSAARALLPEVVALPYDREAYNDAVECVWDVYAVESDRVEPVSPEVCFVALEGLPATIPTRLRWLAERIAPLVGVPLHIGVGRTKMIAREAAKTNGGFTGAVASLPLNGGASDEARLLARVPIAALSSVPRQTAERLRKLGVVTLGDVARLPPLRWPRDLKRFMPLLTQLSRGHDGDPVRPLWPPRKLERTHVFGEEEHVEDLRWVEETLLRLAHNLAKAVSAGGDFCREVVLTVEIENEGCLREVEKRASPTSDGDAIYRSARRLLGRIEIEQPVRGLTLTAGGLGTGSGIQLSLMDGLSMNGGGVIGGLDQMPHERQRRLDAALRHIRSRYGVRAIVTGSLLRQARRIDLWTHALTHRLDEGIVVATDRATGVPLRYWRRRDRGGARQVVRIYDRWKERRWFGDRPGDCTAYRIEADPYQVAELHQLGVEWRLAGRFD